MKETLKNKIIQKLLLSVLFLGLAVAFYIYRNDTNNLKLAILPSVILSAGLIIVRVFHAFFIDKKATLSQFWNKERELITDMLLFLGGFLILQAGLTKILALQEIDLIITLFAIIFYFILRADTAIISTNRLSLVAIITFSTISFLSLTPFNSVVTLVILVVINYTYQKVILLRELRLQK